MTASLVALAALWVLLGYTRAPRPRQAHPLRMVVYFIGLLTIASLLAIRESIFFIFLITGFFHAMVLRPWPVLIAGVFATSVLVNTVIGGLPTNAEWWTIYITIIVIQTLAIGAGGLLGEKMAEQSEQRRLAVASLEAALEENADVHAQLLAQAREAGVLDERQRMAAEIHDTIAQGPTGIVTQLEAAEQAHDRPEAWQRHVRNAIGLARESLAEARRSVEGLRPEHLETARLPGALAEVARQWSELSGVPVEVTTTGHVQPLHAEVEMALLRTAQEALANVAKHANASRARQRRRAGHRGRGQGYLLKDSPRDELFRAVRAASRGESVLASSVATRLMSQLRGPAQEALSDRELEVLSLIAQGETNRGAAARLFISEATVKTDLLHIYAKLNVMTAPPRSRRHSSEGSCPPAESSDTLRSDRRWVGRSQAGGPRHLALTLGSTSWRPLEMVGEH